MRFAFSLFEAEDPELLAELAPLGRYERARRIRALLRVARELERDSGPRPEASPTASRYPVAAVPPAAEILDFDPLQFTFRKDTTCP